MIGNVILETTWSNKAEGTVQHKHVLHEENGHYLYNTFQIDGSGWNTHTFTDFEKAMRFFFKEVSKDRKTWKESRNLKILPNIINSDLINSATHIVFHYQRKGYFDTEITENCLTFIHQMKNPFVQIPILKKLAIGVILEFDAINRKLEKNPTISHELIDQGIFEHVYEEMYSRLMKYKDYTDIIECPDCNSRMTRKFQFSQGHLHEITLCSNKDCGMNEERNQKKDLMINQIIRKLGLE